MICFYSYLVVCYSLFSTHSNLGLQFPSSNLPNSLRVLSVSHSESGRSCDGFYQQSCWGRCHRSFPKSPTRPLRDGSLCWNSRTAPRVQQSPAGHTFCLARCNAMQCDAMCVLQGELPEVSVLAEHVPGFQRIRWKMRKSWFLDFPSGQWIAAFCCTLTTGALEVGWR